MTPEQAVERSQYLLAHAWMIRTFLKHADEIQEEEDFLEVPRLLFDTVRAVEGHYQRAEHADYLRRLRGKLPKIRRVAEFFAREHKRVSVHTNFEMASLSLTGIVRQLEELFAQLDASRTAAAPPESSSEE